MGAFICTDCDAFADSDDGCEESLADPHRLICAECAAIRELEQELEPEQ